jgi:hypothetical protein
MPITIFCEGVWEASLRMSVSITRCFLCWAMAMAMPLSSLGQTPSQETQPQGPPAQGPPAAIIHTQGGVWVNDSEARDSTAVFSGDVIETKPGFSATLDLDGSEILLAPEAVAKFQENALALDHGSVSVGTSKSFKVQVHCVTVAPMANEWTQYEVTDVNGTIQVAARKKDVNVEIAGRAKPSANEGSSGAGVVHEGEQKNFTESEVCGPPPQPNSPSSLNSPKWIAAGAAATGILIWILLHGRSSGQPASPSEP